MASIRVRKLLEIPEKYFISDFLNSEVKKKMAVRGDALLYQINETYRLEVKQQYESLFQKKFFYLVTGVKNGNVIFVETEDTDY